LYDAARCRVYVIETMKHALCCLLIAAWWCVPADGQPAAKPAEGQLVLEGRHIERLVLSDEQGKPVDLRRPGDSVSLPVGPYRILSIEVEGGHTADLGPSAESGSNRLTISPDEPCRPNLGAPLKPRVTVARHGDTLRLDYGRGLYDGDGRQYTSRLSDRAHPPQFAVCRGDCQLVSGQFEYG
jgi:hypothetical protein